MTDKIQDTIQKYNMLKSGERVSVALSGGADSVSLLIALKDLGYDVFAVHVNHNLRGDESDRDEKFCRSLCEKQGVPLYVESVDVLTYCRENKTSLEEGARILRYNAIRKHLDGAKIATAHNLDDCFETTLFNMVRGCAVGGLTGIPAVRDDIIRPLINVAREEITKFLNERNQNYVTDSTNLSDDCSRNIIRLNVIPQLKRINPSLLKTYKSSLENFINADRYIKNQAKRLLSSAKTDGGYEFDKSTDDFILSEAASLMLRENKIEPSGERIKRVKSLVFSDGKINISKGVYVTGAKGRISFERPKIALNLPVKPSGEYIAGDYIVKFTEISQFDISDYNNKGLKSIIDPCKLSGGITLRNCRGNEKIKLSGRDFTSTVKKLLAKYPQDTRKQMIVVSDGDGPVFVQNFGAAQRACADGNTCFAVRIDITSRKDD